MSSNSPLTTIALFKELIRDPDRKSLARIFFEVIYLLFYYREIPRHYFSRSLFKKGTADIVKYLPNKFLYRIKAKFNDPRAREVVENKLFFDSYFRQFDVHLPRILMYSDRKLFVINQHSFKVDDLAGFRDSLLRLFESNPHLSSFFLKKTYWSYGGEGTYRIDRDEIDSETVRIIYEEVNRTSFLYQENISQHRELQRFNPSCLNTIRIDTFIDKNGNAEAISAYFRTNLKGHYTDNDPRGSCEISIDLETGRLKRFGHVVLKYNGIKLPTEHPITKVGFENFQIPHFYQAVELAVRVAGYVPSLRLVGWDVAIGETGPILIEGNSDYDIPTSDMANEGYLTNPVFRKVLLEIGYL